MNRARLRRIGLSLLAPVAAFIFAVGISSLALWASGNDPWTAWSEMLGYANDTKRVISIVNRAVPLYLSALAVGFAFKMNLFNIGVEGQYQLAAVLAASAGAAVDLPAPLHVLFILIIAMGVGAGWAGIAGVLKAYRGVHEVISTIMLNAIVTSGLLAYLLSSYLRDESETSIIKTPPIPESGLMPSLNSWLDRLGVDVSPGSDLQGFVLVAMLIGLAFYVVVWRTRFGYDLRASGVNPWAAQASGVSPKGMILRTMLVSGALAGLVGMPQLLGFFGRYHQDFPTGLGFGGIAVALLGRNNPIGMAIGALLFGFLSASAQILDLNDIPKEIIDIMQATILLSVVVSYEVVRRMVAASEIRAAAEATEGMATQPARTAVLEGEKP
ncbi:MAG TPA: ABC transporter permease [Acidimicrobiales bacterium]|nr:ABC transporter permease [Acidimicrobiales bacterium]